MGNLDGHASSGLTGTTGPGLVLRSIFSELNRFTKAEPLRQSPRLVVARVCAVTGHLAGPSCPTILEKFMPDTLPHKPCREHSPRGDSNTFATAAIETTPPVYILQPSANLLMAMDPHIPDSIEAYPMKLSASLGADRIEWLVDGRLAGITGSTEEPFMWPLQRGNHFAQARIRREGLTFDTPAVRFSVK
jgi:penicillin-binding protein 1C